MGTERGARIFKTTDGGLTWRKVYVDPNTGANDIRMDPTNSQSFMRQRTSGSERLRRNSRGSGSGIYKSTDGGDTGRSSRTDCQKSKWAASGWRFRPPIPIVLPTSRWGLCSWRRPAARRGRRGVRRRAAAAASRRAAVRRRRRRRVPLRRRRRHLGARQLRQRCRSGQFNQMRTDPKDRNHVYRMGTGFYVSDDLGRHIVPMPRDSLRASRDVGRPRRSKSFLARHRRRPRDHVGSRADIRLKNNIRPDRSRRRRSASTRAIRSSSAAGCGTTGICVPSAVRNRNGIGNFDDITVGGGDGMHFTSIHLTRHTG